MPAIFSVKTVILTQYLNIFCPSKKAPRWKVIVSLIVANAIFFTILFFLEIFQCIPRPKIWNPSIPGSCINIEQTFIASGVINVCDDFTILILPISWIWRLQSPLRKKIGICVVFCTGVLYVAFFADRRWLAKLIVL